MPSLQQKEWSPQRNDVYMQWVRRDVPHIFSRHERHHCPYRDMKNHLRWMCKCIEKHANKDARHSCHFCVGPHSTFQCPQRRCNGGLGKLNWAVREKNVAMLEGREVPTFDGPPAAAHPTATPQPASDTQPQPAQLTHSAQAAQPAASTQPMDTSSAASAQGLSLPGAPPMTTSMGYSAMGHQPSGSSQYRCPCRGDSNRCEPRTTIQDI